ncbi:hypothetical protein KZ483_26140 [Paenibacillus sp. sptzw28]|uniref:hypothetical protein n=1 Tax=Paenibacillus sp. sptzw28 TaxID=715179 RepID=UPI001C6E172E|nr:hypothetical protein [Paenibacillus sp. sptzw28]QYR21144.1 hypothetical protein KZ483_26140 [Paenibacillus sp. sptzw28]
MKYRYDPTGRRSFNQPFGGQGQMQDPGMFPGISDSFFGGGNNNAGFNSPAPFQQFQSNTPSIQIQPAFGEVVPLPEQQFGQFGQAAAPAKSGSSFSLNDLKGIVDRMGGIDGIVSTMTKVQKVVSSVSQMAPLIKVLAGSLGKKGAAATIAEDTGIDAAAPRPRKRRRRTGSGAGVTPGGQRRRTKPRKR